MPLTLMMNHSGMLLISVPETLWPRWLLLSHMRLPIHIVQSVLLRYGMIRPYHPSLRNVQVWGWERHSEHLGVSTCRNRPVEIGLRHVKVIGLRDIQTIFLWVHIHE